MDSEFRFDAASSDEEAEVEDRPVHSPWDFASYSESVAEEHARRNTTSVDAKINKALEERVVSHPDVGDDEEEEAEPNDEVFSGVELGKDVRRYISLPFLYINDFLLVFLSLHWRSYYRDQRCLFFLCLMSC